MQQVRAATPSDRPRAEELLTEAGLPLEGVAEHFGTFIVAMQEDRMIGAIGLEIHGEDALLRSAVVARAGRGSGVGSALAEAVITEARRRRLRHLYLLTTSAERFFARFGFAEVPRAEVPAAIRRSPEFAGVCPSTATALALELDDGIRRD